MCAGANRKMRLDKYLAEHGFSSRTKAARALAKGLVTRNGKVAKASDEVAEGDVVEVRAEGQAAFVSEGGQKLHKALECFGADVAGQVFADLGASTGGFTDCLLQRGAARVYAVDVGESQLEARLAGDARVVVMDRTNARYLDAGAFPEPIDGVTADVSFISLTLILPAVARILRSGGHAFALIKPQFECSGRGLDKHGILKDAAKRREIVESVARFACSVGLCPLDLTNAPVYARKNIEYSLYLQKREYALADCAALARKADELT